jgi:hypothetical protein
MTILAEAKTTGRYASVPERNAVAVPDAVEPRLTSRRSLSQCLGAEEPRASWAA